LPRCVSRAGCRVPNLHPSVDTRRAQHGNPPPMPACRSGTSSYDDPRQGAVTGLALRLPRSTGPRSGPPFGAPFSLPLSLQPSFSIPRGARTSLRLRPQTTPPPDTPSPVRRSVSRGFGSRTTAATTPSPRAVPPCFPLTRAARNPKPGRRHLVCHLRIVTDKGRTTGPRPLSPDPPALPAILLAAMTRACEKAKRIAQGLRGGVGFS